MWDNTCIYTPIPIKTAFTMESTTQIYIYPYMTNKHPGSMNTRTLLTVDTKSMTIPPTDSRKQIGDL